MGFIARVARVYESRTNRALVHNYFIARKYCVHSRYVANNYINVFPANTFFNDAYQTISDIQFIATGRVAPVMGYKYVYTRKMVPNTGRARSFLLVIKNKIVRRGRQNKNNRPINLPNVITFSTDFKYTTQSYLYHTQ